jgi:hypothetical protein
VDKIKYQLKLDTNTPSNVATIFHGAYGDYFEQLLCIVDLAQKHPEHAFHLFFANQYRFNEFQKLDMSFAASVELAEKIEDTNIDIFYQFQVFDQELQDDILSKLSDSTLEKLDRTTNLLPHIYMQNIQALKKQRFTLPFSKLGTDSFNDALSTLPADIFKGKTIGFMWRYRDPNGAVSPFLMPDKQVLVKKYTDVFKEAIETWGCNVIVAGMKVKTTERNKFYVDKKYPEFGLSFEHDNLHYLPGKGWLAEVEIMAKCDIVICNPSGFSEAIFLKGKECIVVDSPLHYVLKTIKNGFPLFNIGLKSWTQIVVFVRNLLQLHNKSFLTRSINKLFSKK